MEGWIKLFRCLLDKPIWQCTTPEQKAILITILLLANHEEKTWVWEGKKYTCLPGQFITSLKRLADKSGTSVKNVRTALKNFEEIYDFSASKAASKGQVVTVLNWASYQSDEDETASKTANGWHEGGTRVATNKNDKNEKNEKKKINIHSVIDEITSQSPALNEALHDFAKMRIQIKKPMTEKALALLIAKLGRLSTDEYMQIKILEQSITHCWQDVYALKKDNQPFGQAEEKSGNVFLDIFKEENGL